MAETYIKSVSTKEAAIYNLAASAGISPPIIEYKEGKIKTVKYTSLIELPERKKYYSQIIEQLEKLHSLGILWMDPSEENVVIDTTNNQVYLIDFGSSQYIKLLHPDDQILSRAKEIEKREVKFFCGMGKKPDELNLTEKDGKTALSIEII